MSFQVRYFTYDARGNLATRLYRDRAHNKVDLNRTEASTAARRMADRHGFAQIMFGGDVYATYGDDPR